MAVQGVFLSDQGIRGELNTTFSGSVLRMSMGGTAPLLALSSGMKSRNTTDTVVGWIDETQVTGYLKVAVSQTLKTDTTVVLEDASTVLERQFYTTPSGEMLLVTGVSGNTITVRRGHQNTADLETVLEADTYIQLIGTQFEEASAPPSSVYNMGTPQFNYTHIVRNSWGVSGTAAAVNFATGDRVANSKRQAAQQHAEDIERILWFSRKANYIANGKPYRAMGGVGHFNTENAKVQTAATTYSDLNNFFADVFKYNIDGEVNERICMTGNSAVLAFNEISKQNTTMQITPGASVYGMQIWKWVTPFGNINFMTHPLFNANPIWSKTMWLLHPATMTMRYLRPTFVDPIVGDGSDESRGVYTTELTAEFRGTKCNGHMTNIYAAAA